MSLGARVGILGGTLDPVHVGHVETALAARDALALDRVLLLPSRIPPHRPLQPSASPFHRFAMAALAVNGIDGARSVRRRAALRRDRPTRLRRSSAFTSQARDRRRFSSSLAPTRLQKLKRGTDTRGARPGELRRRLTPGLRQPSHRRESAGARRPRYRPPRSARASVATDTRILILQAATPDVSSTEIRRRLRAGEPIAGLVTEAVERHIRQHRLYMGDGSSTLTHTAADHLHGEN